MTDISIEQLMKVGVHFGHKTKRWNPKMKKYIFTSRNGISIIDLQQTVRNFSKATEFIRKTAANGGTLLFVGTKTQARQILVEQATRCGMPYITERWLGGMLTNFETIRKSVGRLKDLDKMADDGTLAVLSKKESIKLSKERAKLERNLGGIKNMEKLPDAVFILDTNKEHIGLAEALKLKIKVVAVVDTNCDPEGIEYVIPGNDDAVKAITLMASAMADNMLAGAEEYELKRQALVEEKAKAEAEAVKAKEEKAAKVKEEKAAKDAAILTAAKRNKEKSASNNNATDKKADKAKEAASSVTKNAGNSDKSS